MNKLEVLRTKLNYAVENNEDKDEILKISQELDILIVKEMTIKLNKLKNNDKNKLHTE